MFLSNPVKIFHVLWFFLLVFAGCSFWRNESNTAPPPASPLKTDYPFSTNEPEVFQTEIVVRTGDVESRMFMAWNGNMSALTTMSARTTAAP